MFTGRLLHCSKWMTLSQQFLFTDFASLTATFLLQCSKDFRWIRFWGQNVQLKSFRSSPTDCAFETWLYAKGNGGRNAWKEGGGLTLRGHLPFCSSRAIIACSTWALYQPLTPALSQVRYFTFFSNFWNCFVSTLICHILYFIHTLLKLRNLVGWNELMHVSFDLSEMIKVSL